MFDRQWVCLDDAFSNVFLLCGRNTLERTCVTKLNWLAPQPPMGLGARMRCKPSSVTDDTDTALARRTHAERVLEWCQDAEGVVTSKP